MSNTVNGKYIFNSAGEVIEVILPFQDFVELKRRAGEALDELERPAKTRQVADGDSPAQGFMSLPLNERRQIMKQQAAQMVAHYEQTASDREPWQGGDFADER